MTKIESGAATRQRLLEAAETLFAEQGFEKVAVRDVTEKAGANVAAVNYHFGSRDGLVDKVIERYISPVNDERLARLDGLERKMAGKPVAIEEILEAFVRPFLTQIQRSELSERLCFQLIGRMLSDRVGKMPPAVEMQFQIVAARFKHAFKKALPEVEEEDLVWRMQFMAGGMIHAMTMGEMVQRMTQGAAGSPTMEKTLSRLIRFAAAGLRQGSGGKPNEPSNPSLEEAEKSEEIPQSEFLF